MRTAQHRAECHMQIAQAAVKGSLVFAVVLRRRLPASMPRCVSESALLREKQQKSANELQQRAFQHLTCRFEGRLLNRRDGVGKAVIQAHLIVFQHRKLAGNDNRFEAVFDRGPGLHLDQLVGPGGQAERARRRDRGLQTGQQRKKTRS
ncbi:MAG: hypothetical protein K2Y16_02410 [Burkholderiales bacterium]|nr:hypothetical protein [Burkholderiales bacterium]